jgi:hypothetical protein
VRRPRRDPSLGVTRIGWGRVRVSLTQSLSTACRGGADVDDVLDSVDLPVLGRSRVTSIEIDRVSVSIDVVPVVKAVASAAPGPPPPGGPEAVLYPLTCHTRGG